MDAHSPAVRSTVRSLRSSSAARRSRRSGRRATGPLAAALVIAMLIAIGGCTAKVSVEQAQEAFVVAYGAASVGSMAASLGRELPGTVVTEAGARIEFSEFDVLDLGTDYQWVSGTVTTSADDSGSATGASVQVAFTLGGGPVDTISFRLPASELASDATVSTTVTADGRKLDVSVVAPGQ